MCGRVRSRKEKARGGEGGVGFSLVLWGDLGVFSDDYSASPFGNTQDNQLATTPIEKLPMAPLAASPQP